MADELSMGKIAAFFGKKIEYPLFEKAGIEMGGKVNLSAELDYLCSAASPSNTKLLGKDHLNKGVTEKDFELLQKLNENLRLVAEGEATPLTEGAATKAFVHARKAFNDVDPYGKYAQAILDESAQVLGIDNLKGIADSISGESGGKGRGGSGSKKKK
jgi:hypothetical protein